jgi:hypothetical protein
MASRQRAGLDLGNERLAGQSRRRRRPRCGPQRLAHSSLKYGAGETMPAPAATPRSAAITYRQTQTSPDAASATRPANTNVRAPWRRAASSFRSQDSPSMKTKSYFCPPDGLSGAPLATGRSDSSLTSGTCLGKNASLIPIVSPMANIASQKSQPTMFWFMGTRSSLPFCYPTA